LFSLLLSSARSLIFNDLLSERVKAGNWDKALPGEVLMLDGSHSVFKAMEGEAELPRRLKQGDVHPTGPLWGRGEPLVSGDVLALETQVAERHPALVKGLVKVGVEMARRSLRLPVKDFTWHESSEGLILEFFLPAGAYATTVLGELVDFIGDANAEED
jgi:tRNA pseudouridine13 synthase